MSFFTNGGAEANENAIKLARWYTGRHKIVARYRSLPRRDRRRDHAHRRPAPLARRARHPGRRAHARPVHVPLPRRAIPIRAPSARARRTSRRSSSTRAPQTVAAVILETVTGTNGIIVPPDGYLQSIREVCDRHGILLIADEVMAGFGRTGKWFAVDHWDVVPDILTHGEGHQLRLRAARRDGRVASRSPTGCATSYFAGGLTYSGHPLACAAARRLDRGVPRGGHRRERGRDGRGLPRRARRARGREAPVDRRGARARLLLGARARAQPRDARAARPVQRRRRGGGAGRAHGEGGARARASTS